MINDYIELRSLGLLESPIAIFATGEGYLRLVQQGPSVLHEWGAALTSVGNQAETTQILLQISRTHQEPFADEASARAYFWAFVEAPNVALMELEL